MRVESGKPSASITSAEEIHAPLGVKEAMLPRARQSGRRNVPPLPAGGGREMGEGDRG